MRFPMREDTRASFLIPKLDSALVVNELAKLVDVADQVCSRPTEFPLQIPIRGPQFLYLQDRDFTRSRIKYDLSAHGPPHIFGYDPDALRPRISLAIETFCSPIRNPWSSSGAPPPSTWATTSLRRDPASSIMRISAAMATFPYCGVALTGRLRGASMIHPAHLQHAVIQAHGHTTAHDCSQGRRLLAEVHKAGFQKICACADQLHRCICIRAIPLL